MKFNYDRVADAIYLNLSKGKIKKTVELDNSVVVDVGEKGKLIGIEILNFSKHQKSKGGLAKLAEFGVPMQIVEATAKMA